MFNRRFRVLSSNANVIVCRQMFETDRLKALTSLLSALLITNLAKLRDQNDVNLMLSGRKRCQVSNSSCTLFEYSPQHLCVRIIPGCL